jgi:putative ABC transport system permease protein
VYPATGCRQALTAADAPIMPLAQRRRGDLLAPRPTPRQITAGLAIAQLPSALLGALLGIPGGIAIYNNPTHHGATMLPSALGLVGMVVLSLLAIAALTAVSTRIGARRPVAEVLQAEAA